MKLLIAVPTLDFIHVNFAKSLTALIMRLNAEGIAFDVHFESGTLVYHARNKIAMKAIHEGFTHVLWFDSDMVFTDDIFDDLSFCEKPFVSGICHGRRPPHVSCLFKSIRPVERFTEYPYQHFEIAACGFGCVLMETRILAEVKKKFGTCFLPIEDLGEDVAFCWRVSECGIKMYAEPSARLGHIGHITIYPEDAERWRDTLTAN